MRAPCWVGFDLEWAVVSSVVDFNIASLVKFRASLLAELQDVESSHQWGAAIHGPAIPISDKNLRFLPSRSRH